MKRKTNLLLIIFVVLVLITSCTINIPHQPIEFEEEEPIQEEEEYTPVRGGNLRIPISQPDTFNPLMTRSREMMNFFNLIFEGLLKYDQNLRPVPALAESWEVSDDGTLWSFKLRENVKWHNGSTFSGNDVIFTFEALRSGKLGSYYDFNIANNQAIEEIYMKSGDPNVIHVRLNTPIYNMLDIMTFPILSQEIYVSDDYMLDNTTNLEIFPVGTGPYKFDESGYLSNQQIELVVNKDWWNTAPYIEKITAKVFQTNEQARNAFKSDLVDIVDTMVIFAGTYASTEDVYLLRYLTQNYDFLGFNHNNPIFQDQRVRQAIAYAIDRKEIISRIYLNNAEAIDVPIQSNSWVYDSNYRIYDYNGERSRALLREAGWEDTNGNGILNKVDEEDQELSFTILVNRDNELRKDVLQLIIEQLSEVGIEAIPIIADWNEDDENAEDDNQDYRSRLINGDFDMAISGYYLDFLPDLRFMFHSSGIDENSMKNFINYSNTSLDSQLDRLVNTFEEDKIKESYSNIQGIISRDLPVISLYFNTSSLLVNRRIQGVERPVDLNIFTNIHEWYIIK